MGMMFASTIIIYLIYLGLMIFGIYAVVKALSHMKQKNQILAEIRDEMRKGNSGDPSL